MALKLGDWYILGIWGGWGNWGYPQPQASSTRVADTTLLGFQFSVFTS